MDNWSCSCSKTIYDEPVLPKTRAAAKKQGKTVNEYLEAGGKFLDRNICFVTGRICPRSIADCDAKISLNQIEEEFRYFMGFYLKDKPLVAQMMLKYFCDCIKPIIKVMDYAYLMRLIGTKDVQGISQALIAELSFQRKEITEWNLIPSKNFDILLEMLPVNDHRVVTYRIANMMGAMPKMPEPPSDVSELRG